MATPSVSGADNSVLAVVTPGKNNNEGVTSSSESQFSSVLDASAKPVASTNTQSAPSGTSSGDKQDTAQTASSMEASSAVEILNNLQASQKMDTSLKLKADASATMTANASVLAAQVPQVPQVPQVSPAISSSNETSATKGVDQNNEVSDSDEQQKPQSVQDPDTCSASSTPTSSPSIQTSVKNTSDTLPVSEQIVSLQPQLSGSNQPIAATSNIANKNSPATTDMAQSANNDMTDTDNTTSAADTETSAAAKNDKKSKDTVQEPLHSQESAATDTSAILLNPLLQVPQNTTTISQTTSGDSSENSVEMSQTKSASPSALANHSIQALITQMKGNASSQKQDESGGQNNVVSNDGSGSDDAVTDATTQAIANAHDESAEKKSDFHTLLNTHELNENMATAISANHENSSLTSTDKSSLSSASLTDQTQGLKSIHEQLPAIYTKNGQIEEHDLAARVMLMAGEKWQEAELQLEPQDMGKLHIKLTIDQEQQANVQFMVQHAQTKDVLEQSLPRLRELLSQNGLQPGQTQVQQQNTGSSGQSWSQQMANQSTGNQQGERGNTSGRSKLLTGQDEDFAQTVTISASQAAGIDFYA